MAYPYGTISQVVDGVDDVDQTAWNELVDALNDLETMLGADPEGGQADLETRLDAEHANDGTHAALTATSLSNAGASVLTGNVTTAAQLNLGPGSELTISGGLITVTGSYHIVDTESDGAADDLNTIDGGTNGQILVLMTAADARAVTYKDGADNLQLAGDFVADSTQDRLVLISDGTNWAELSRSSNA